MKNVIFIFIIIFSFQALNAQSTYHKLIDTNKVWNNIGTNPPWEYTKFYKFSSDTVMGGLTYHWLRESNDSINWIKIALMREDTISKKVYLYGYSYGVFQGGEGLIYDFSASINDTVALFNPVMCNDTCRIIITDIDSVMVGNQYRKKFHIDNLDLPTCFFLSDFFIEGIGYEYGLYDIGGGLVGGDLPRLVCYHENDSLMYVNPYYGQCFTTILGVADNESQPTINIESQGLNVFLIKANKPVKEIAVYNITGQKIFSKSCYMKELTLSLSDYPQGVYFVKISLKSNFVDVKKVMKL